MFMQSWRHASITNHFKPEIDSQAFSSDLGVTYGSSFEPSDSGSELSELWGWLLLRRKKQNSVNKKKGNQRGKKNHLKEMDKVTSIFFH